VRVQKRSRDQPLSHEFSLVLDADFQPFMLMVEKRIEVSGKIARALGNRHPINVRITRLERGSVVLCWTNSSLMPSNRLHNCPVQVSNCVAYLQIITTRQRYCRGTRSSCCSRPIAKNGQNFRHKCHRIAPVTPVFFNFYGEIPTAELLVLTDSYIGPRGESSC